MSYADLESALSLADSGLLSPVSFKRVVERIAKRKGAPAVASFEVRVHAHTCFEG